jgi:hypothetical protein
MVGGCYLLLRHYCAVSLNSPSAYNIASTIATAWTYMREKWWKETWKTLIIIIPHGATTLFTLPTFVENRARGVENKNNCRRPSEVFLLVNKAGKWQ